MTVTAIEVINITCTSQMQTEPAKYKELGYEEFQHESNYAIYKYSIGFKINCRLTHVINNYLSM